AGRRSKEGESVQVTIGDYELSVEVSSDGIEEVVVTVGGIELSRARLKRKDGQLLKKLLEKKAKPEKGKAKVRHVYIEDDDNSDSEDNEIEEIIRPTSEYLGRIQTARYCLTQRSGDLFLKLAFARGSPRADGWIGKAATSFLIDSGSEI